MKIVELKYKVVNNHIIFNIDEKTALLDTGANSIGNTNITFFSKEFKTADSFLGSSIEDISKFVGVELDILFGIDIIKEYDLLINAKTKTLMFSDAELVLDGAELELDKNCVIETVVDDENVKMFFDTGAKISYIHSKFTNNIAIFGQSNDFFPGYGRFDLETCHLKTHIGTKGINIRYGKLPEDLEERLLQYTDGIIGIDLLKSFNCLLSFKRNTMVLQPYKNKKIVFFTGAGISAESGISTFRDSGGVWEEYDIEKVCSAGCLDTNRDETLEFYDKRRFDLKNKRPNKAHYTIAKLQEEYPKSVHIITQNVDDLFEKAGCKDVLHLHGFLTKVRCEDDKCDYITDIGYSEIGYESCPLCGEYLRPDVVFFGEEAPNYLKMYSLLKDVDITVVIGTSGNVINVNNVIENSKYNILNNLEQDNVIDDKKFDKLIYSRATVAIDEIEKTIIKAICEN